MTEEKLEYIYQTIEKNFNNENIKCQCFTPASSPGIGTLEIYIPKSIINIQSLIGYINCNDPVILDAIFDECAEGDERTHSGYSIEVCSEDEKVNSNEVFIISTVYYYSIYSEGGRHAG